MIFEERAALMEYEGGLERKEAERRARKIIQGRAAEPEQVELDLGQQEFRQAMRQLWKDY